MKIIQSLCKDFPTEDFVVCHNDPQQGNILVLNQDASVIKLIDYELTTFGWRFWDLASFIHCFMKDNTYSQPPFVKFYQMNTVTEWELRHYVDYFLQV